MKNNLIKYCCYTLLAIASYLVWYTLVSFVMFDLNAGNWGIHYRVVVVILGTITAIGLIGLIDLDSGSQLESVVKDHIRPDNPEYECFDY